MRSCADVGEDDALDNDRLLIFAYYHWDILVGKVWSLLITLHYMCMIRTTLVTKVLFPISKFSNIGERRMAEFIIILSSCWLWLE